MIRRAPPISTTGGAGEVSVREYGRTSASRAAASIARRSWSRALAKTSGDAGGEVAMCRVPPVSVVVEPVASRSDLNAFIDLPYRLHATSAQWVPPLRVERTAFLSPRPGRES